MCRFTLLLALLATLGRSAVAAEPKIAQRWAVLIGVDNYANFDDLQFCGADQSEFRNRLVGGGMSADRAVLLHDKATDPRLRPTTSNVKRELQSVLSRAKADDLVIIGFRGQGVSIDGTSYLCAADADLADLTTLISSDDLCKQIDDCPARLKVVLVDAGRKAVAQPVAAAKRSKKAGDGKPGTPVPAGAVLIHSCAPGESSWEDKELGHSVFMHYLLDAISGAGDANSDGALSLMELQQYVSGKTKSYVVTRHGGIQRPFFKADLTITELEFPLIPVAKANVTVP